LRKKIFKIEPIYIYLKIPVSVSKERMNGKDVYILQTGSKSPNEDIMELCLMCQAAKLGFAKSVHAIIPHFPYSRQECRGKREEYFFHICVVYKEKTRP
jgi:phosphoribosylpyrophosphate synthetase